MRRMDALVSSSDPPRRGRVRTPGADRAPLRGGLISPNTPAGPTRRCAALTPDSTVRSGCTRPRGERRPPRTSLPRPQRRGLWQMTRTAARSAATTAAPGPRVAVACSRPVVVELNEVRWRPRAAGRGRLRVAALTAKNADFDSEVERVTTRTPVCAIVMMILVALVGTSAFGQVQWRSDGNAWRQADDGTLLADTVTGTLETSRSYGDFKLTMGFVITTSDDLVSLIGRPSLSILIGCSGAEAEGQSAHNVRVGASSFVSGQPNAGGFDVVACVNAPPNTLYAPSNSSTAELRHNEWNTVVVAACRSTLTVRVNGSELYSGYGSGNQFPVEPLRLVYHGHGAVRIQSASLNACG